MVFLMIGELIKLWRQKHGHSIRAAAEIIGISRDQLHRIEQGKTYDAGAMFTIFAWVFGRK